MCVLQADDAGTYDELKQSKIELCESLKSQGTQLWSASRVTPADANKVTYLLPF